MKIPTYLNPGNIYRQLQVIVNQKFILKLIALFLAIITWLYVHGEIRKRPSVMPINNSDNNNF